MSSGPVADCVWAPAPSQAAFAPGNLVQSPRRAGGTSPRWPPPSPSAGHHRAGCLESYPIDEVQFFGIDHLSLGRVETLAVDAVQAAATTRTCPCRRERGAGFTTISISWPRSVRKCINLSVENPES